MVINALCKNGPYDGQFIAEHSPEFHVFQGEWYEGSYVLFTDPGYWKVRYEWQWKGKILLSKESPE